MHVSAVRVFVVKGLLLLQITIIYDDFLESFKYFRPLFQSQNPESGRRSIPGFRDPKCCPDRNPMVAVRPPWHSAIVLFENTGLFRSHAVSFPGTKRPHSERSFPGTNVWTFRSRNETA